MDRLSGVGVIWGGWSFATGPASAVPSSEAVPELGYGWALVKMLVALVVVCAAAYLLLRFGLRRLASPRLAGARHLRVIERCPLSAGRALWLVEVGGRYLLVGEAEGGLTRVAEIDPGALEQPDAGPPQRTFLELLRGKSSGGRAEGGGG